MSTRNLVPNLRAFVYTQYGRNAFCCQGNTYVHAHTLSAYLKNLHIGNHRDVYHMMSFETITMREPRAWLIVRNLCEFQCDVWKTPHLFYHQVLGNRGRDSPARIATRYGLKGPGIESRGGGEIFHTRPDRPWGPPSLLHNGYRIFPMGKADGAWRWPPTPSSAEGEGRVELYICSPSGP